VRAHHDHFVLQRGIGPFGERHDVAIGHDVPVDVGGQRDLDVGQRRRRDAAGRLGRCRQIPQGPAGAADQRLRGLRRDLRHGDRHRLHPGRETVALHAQRRLGPVAARRHGEVARFVVVHVRHDEQARGAPRLGAQGLPQGAGGLGPHDAIEGTLRIGLTRLVVEHEQNGPPHGVALQVVVVAFRRRDAESGEHDRSGRVARTAEAMGVEVHAWRQVAASPGLDDREAVLGAQGGRHQVVPVEVGALGSGGLQAEPREPHADELGCRRVAGRVRESSLERVGCQEVQVGAEIVLADRVVPWRRGGRGASDEAEGQQDDGGESHGHGASSFAPIIRAASRRRPACSMARRSRHADPGGRHHD